MFEFSNPVVDLNGLKEMVTNHGSFLKSQIDSCHMGQIVSLSTRLPRHCTPGQAKICFSTDAGMYAIMVDRPVYYCGTVWYLRKLFTDGIIVFDNWQELENFFLLLPYDY